MIYNLISETTGEIVGYTKIGPFDTDHDIPDSELLDVRRSIDLRRCRA